MSPILCQTSQADYRTAYHIPLPKISSIDQDPALCAQVTSPCRRSLSTHIVEGDSTPKAKPAINKVVPRPSDEHPIIQKLKDVLRIQPDQTTVLTWDDVDLYSLPEVERFLESSRVRLDYNSSTRSITTTMTSKLHEFGARSIRNMFEPRMISLQSKYGGSWVYETNCLLRVYEPRADRVRPTAVALTPDGAISDKSGLLLPIEVSTSQKCEAAGHKMTTFFSNPSVIAGIIVNVDETKPYSSPDDANRWDSAEEFVEWSEWDEVGRDAWKPIMFAGYRWAGVFSCHIEIHWPNVDSDRIFAASVVPSPSKEEQIALNDELTEVWKTLVETHYNHSIGADEYRTLDIESFRLHLWESIRQTAYDRYANIWSRDNNNRPPITPIQLNQEARIVRGAAAEDRVVRLQERLRIGRGEENKEEEAEGSLF